ALLRERRAVLEDGARRLLEKETLDEAELAALVGAGPDRGLAITRPSLSRGLTASLPEDVTTGLVGRRPDIAAARERAEAAARRVQAARADFFPAIRLDALIGLQSLGLDMLFQSDSVFGRVGPAINLPIFRGGALKGRHSAAIAAYDEAVADYDHAVLAAFRELADIVTSRAATSRRLADARIALEASEEAYAIARLRYEGGLSDYLDVLAVEDRLLDARLAVAGLETGERLLDIALIRALGGGFGAWDTPAAKDIPHG
ncbi:MAG: efflux transporter outer membrane subunit, partial [Novosphingobium sp.]|nr:efflux transporter outer membrane subunit [Novosphingobium sp.]